MPDVIGIRFKSCGKVYDFEINGLKVDKGDRVVVESEFGLSIGNVIVGPHGIEGTEKGLKKALRLATEEDIKQKRDNENFEKEAKNFCLERIMARGLPMKLICAEVTLDRKRIIFYFTADGRIDFRELVKDLAAKFKTRIEMRQIGVRDKAKLVGGLGLCGKELCCRLFLTSFEPISIKMAKQQELVLNTGKLSGICGRLMCCLGFEYNDGVSDISFPPDKTSVIPAEEDEVAVVAAGNTVAGAEVLCSAAETPLDVRAVQPAEAGKQDEQKSPKEFKRHRKRKRYRKKFHKNE